MHYSLFDSVPHSISAREIVPALVRIEQVSSADMVSAQKRMSKAIWRPAPGRKLAFFVYHETDLIGLIFLASPVINLSVRDRFLKMPQDSSDRGRALRSIMDLSVCVGAQPLAWHWNLGKLCAMLATTLCDEFHARYGEDLKWITTTSLWGKGCQYNRVYKFLGYTKGYGHEHIDDAAYARMLSWMRDNQVQIPSCRFGEGSNPRMRRIAAYRKASGDTSVTLKHGQQRGVYVHQAINSSLRSEVVMRWYQRWGLPRWMRTRSATPPYTTGINMEAA
jgi:hypothetical protein